MHRVLLVDDARLLAELEGTALARRSLVRRIVSRDADLLAEALALRPELIVLEEGEFCPDALDAARRLASHPVTRSIPVLYIGSPLHRERAVDLGVRAFAARPVTRRALREALDSSGLIVDRSSVRRVVDMPARLRFDDGEMVSGRCIDLCLGGALLEFDLDLELGSSGSLFIDTMPTQIQLRATLIRGGSGYGTRFDPLPLSDAVHFSRFVRRAGERRHARQVEAAPAGGDRP
ncbi:MAG: PilZ domain-containing protein [Acidobacteriota bacterium]